MNYQAPNEGEGLHQWLLMRSRELLMQGLTIEDATAQLLRETRNVNRTTQDLEGEIINALEGADEFLREHPDFVIRGSRRKEWVDPWSWVGLDDPLIRKDRRTPRLPVDVNLQKEAYRKSRGLDKKGLEGAESLDFYLENLFGSIDFLLCATIEQSRQPIIKLLSELEGHHQKYQYIVPTPLRGRHYGRSDYGTGERLFMVVEFDKADFREQIAYLVYLEKWTKFPLVMVVFSGNKSYHGWYACFGQSEHRCITFSRKATQLGADRTTQSPSQYVRMPQGYNYKWKKQQGVIYFNEDKLEVQHDLLDKEF
jgi:hypothetical protein